MIRRSQLLVIHDIADISMELHQYSTDHLIRFFDKDSLFLKINNLPINHTSPSFESLKSIKYTHRNNIYDAHFANMQLLNKHNKRVRLCVTVCY